jgi:pimeloyl-ACP methyl ester carboxylesterase
MWATPSVWDDWQGWFTARGWRCIIPALRHHDVDPSEAPDPRLGGVSIEEYVADLEGEIRRLPEPPVIMGHSLGGLIAQKLIARGLARRAVLLTPAAPAGIMALRWSVVRSFLSYFLRPGFWKRPHRATFGEMAYSTFHLLDAEEQRRVYSTLVHESGRVIFETGLWPLDRRRAAAVPAGPLPCPTLVVAGGRDRIVPASVVRKTASRYGDSVDYLELPDHAHWVLGEEGWEEICEQVAAWLEEDADGKQAAEQQQEQEQAQEEQQKVGGEEA